MFSRGARTDELTLAGANGDLQAWMEREGDKQRKERETHYMDIDYHSDFSAVSKSMLQVFYDSPVEYKLRYIEQTLNPPVSTKYMELGTVCHKVLLERLDLRDVCAVYPAECLKSDGSLNGKAAAEYRRNTDKMCVKQDTFDEYAALLDSLEESVLAEAIANGGAREWRVDAEIEGVACKCKPDLVGYIDNEHMVIYDLKFVGSVARPTFERQANRLRYWLQDAHYTAVCEKHHGVPCKFRFFAIETSFPYRVQCYWYDERSREIARANHAAKLRELRECMESGVWEDRWQSEITLPPWALDDADQMVEFGEEEAV